MSVTLKTCFGKPENVISCNLIWFKNVIQYNIIEYIYIKDMLYIYTIVYTYTLYTLYTHMHCMKLKSRHQHELFFLQIDTYTFEIQDLSARYRKWCTTILIELLNHFEDSLKIEEYGEPALLV